MACCNGKGPGFATPLDAMRLGQRESLLYVTCARTKQANRSAAETDLLATVDVDPNSATYCKVISALPLKSGDEVHHSGWNACSSCFGNPSACRSHLILPCLNSSRVYVVDVNAAPGGRAPKVFTTIEPDQLLAHNVSFPHTTHCLADGNIMISTLGDKEGNNKGSFVLADAKTFELKGTWPNCAPVAYGYDYWYQPYHKVMLSTEWGVPNLIRKGFNLNDVMNGKYGHSINVWNWESHKLVQSIELDPVKGCMPLEVRFKHDPLSKDAFCGSALGSCIYHIYQESPSTGPNCIGKWNAKPVVELPPMLVKNWPISDKLPALITDIILSLDDRFLYISLWLHGEIHQYDVTRPSKPVLVDKVKISGMCVEGELEPADGPNWRKTVINGKTIEGGPQMLQLSLDGKRLYVTTSLYSAWDNQFYPKMRNTGSSLMLVDINDTKNGGMTLNKNFLIDFGNMPDNLGPTYAHEMRYPGGDCSSDIWLHSTSEMSKL